MFTLLAIHAGDKLHHEGAHATADAAAHVGVQSRAPHGFLIRFPETETGEFVLWRRVPGMASYGQIGTYDSANAAVDEALARAKKESTPSEWCVLRPGEHPGTGSGRPHVKYIPKAA